MNTVIEAGQLELDDIAVRTADRQHYFNNNREELQRVTELLLQTSAKFIRIEPNRTDMDLGFTGDQEAFKELWGALRSAGYKPTTRPEKDELFTDFYTTFINEETDLKIWLDFSSTICKRVKTGTKMVEQPIYEVQCE